MMISGSVAAGELGEFETLRAWPSRFAALNGLLAGFECCALILGFECFVLKAWSPARLCVSSLAGCLESFTPNA